MLPPPAIVDASVLYSRHLRNALVWHSLEGLFELRWSTLILDETRRSLIERNLTAHGEERTSAVDRVLERVTSALSAIYPDAEVSTEQIRPLLEQMTNHPKDRHVLAAAVATKAPFVVTANLKDFRPQDTRPYGIEALSADAFLTQLLDDEQAVELCSAALAHQANFHGWTLPQLLALLGRSHATHAAGLPQYVRQYERLR
jgi:predicted nucleic acid-binding protein